jgi:serine/threonine protein kinase
MHSHHVLHCDLKPDNLVYTRRGQDSLKIIDFGMARFWNARERETFSQTAGYVSTFFFANPCAHYQHN